MKIKKIIYQVFLGDVLFKMIPIKKDIVLFSSFFGQHYSDGPRAISEELHKIAPYMQIYWAFETDSNHDVPEYVHAVNMNSVKYVFVKSRASFIVTNVYHQAGYLSGKWRKDLPIYIHLKMENRKKQSVLTTWHGTPLKKMGNDQVNATKKRFICNQPFYYVVGNKFEEEIMMRLTNQRMIPLLWGSPRTTSITLESQQKIIQLKLKIGIEPDDHVILFAPTFRYGKDGSGIDFDNSGIHQIEMIDFKSLNDALQKKFGWKSWKLICRFHNLVEQQVDWSKLSENYDGHLISGNVLEDIRDYYKISDMVITDYSSVMFDFMITQRPVFLFCHDYENYKNHERGMYFCINEMPFSVSKTGEDLINNILQFDKDEYNNKLTKFMLDLGFVKDKDVLTRICDLILGRAEV